MSICVAGASQRTRSSIYVPDDTKHKRFCIARFLGHLRDGHGGAPSASQVVSLANEFHTAVRFGIEPEAAIFNVENAQKVFSI